MSVLSEIQSRASALSRKIVLSEGADPRIVTAALRAVETGIASIVLVGSRSEILAEIDAQGGELSERLTIEDPQNSPLTETVAAAYFERRKHKGASKEAAFDQARAPLVFSAMLVKLGYADGTVGGAVATTADTVRAALQVIGKSETVEIVSSCMLMVFPEAHPSGREAVVFSDCGMVVDPDANQLATIAAQSADTFSALMDRPAKVAMLSFSTLGSGKHDAVTKVATAASHLKERHPQISSDGEMQFDAAFAPQVAASKAPGSPVAGQANVFVFPSLEAGNIGYKIAERIGGCMAVGPILQGLANPANDLSRGCSAEDVFNLIAVTALQSAATN